MQCLQSSTCNRDEDALADAVEGPTVAAVLKEGAVQDASAAREGGERGAEADEAA